MKQPEQNNLRNYEYISEVKRECLMFEFEYFNSLMSPRMREIICNACIKILHSNVLHILGLIRELKHSNSNMRHYAWLQRVVFFWDTLYIDFS